MLDKLLEILKDLLPSRELPTGVWAVRLVSVSCVSLVFVLVVHFLLQGTPLGDRMGVSKPRPILPVLSQTELVYSRRETQNELAKFTDTAPDKIQSSFLTFITRKKDGNVIDAATASDKRVYPLIWIWYVPRIERLLSLRLIENSFVPSIELYQERFKERTHGNRFCLFNKLPPNSLMLLRRGIAGFSSNYVAACAVYDKNEVPIGAVITYIKLEPNLTVDQENEILYPITDRLRSATDTIEPKYSDMTVNYQFLYNSKP